MVDDRGVQQVVSLNGTEIFDCLEKECLTIDSKRYSRRHIFKKFNANLMIKSDKNDNTNYTVSTSTLILQGLIQAKLTVFNIKTIISVINFQKSCQANTNQYMILTPVQIVDRESRSPANGKTRAYLNFEGFTFLYIDNYKQVLLPVFRVDVRSRDIQLDSAAAGEFYTGLRVDASYNNSRTARWEPLAEPCYFDVVYRAKDSQNVVCVMAGSDDSQEALCFNVSEELVEVVAHCARNLSNILGARQAVEIGNSPKNSAEQGLVEEGISESQFLVRNLTGYDFVVQTVGDKKSKPITINDQQEKFVNFIQEDEFALKETINRSIILTFDKDLGQSKPL
jgi:hypothetical protein